MLLLVFWVVTLAGLIMVLAFRPERTRHSWSELQRRGDKQVIRREHLLGDVLGLRRVAVGLLLVCLVLLGMAAWQVWGIVVSVAVWLVGGAVVRWKPLHGYAMKTYGNFEPQLLAFVEGSPIVGRLARTENYVPHDQHVESVEHLLHLVDQSAHILTSDQRELIRRGVHWHETLVRAVMTPVVDIVSVKSGELIGPLMLDDLHRSGHDRFPVFRGTIDNVVGVLDITELLEISSVKRSETAEKAMLPKVLRIESDEPLPAALALLQKGRQHMLIVVNDEGKTVGLVTLADIAGALLGKNVAYQV